MDRTLEQHVCRYATGDGRIVVLTGAGVSAESGIPTFRGEEGYWQVGSRHYHPQEMATFRAFCDMPDEVWAWYLYRRAVCRATAPNAAHEAARPTWCRASLLNCLWTWHDARGAGCD